MKDPKEIAQQVVLDWNSDLQQSGVSLRLLIAAAIQARDDEHKKEYSEAMTHANVLVISLEVKKLEDDKDALRKELTESDFVLNMLKSKLTECQHVSDELAVELDRITEAARVAKGSRDVHNVYEVLDLIPALRKERDKFLKALREIIHTASRFRWAIWKCKEIALSALEPEVQPAGEEKK